MVMGRPKKDDPKTKSLNVKIQQSLLDKTKKYAHERNMSIGEVVRLALEKLFEK